MGAQGRRRGREHGRPTGSSPRAIRAARWSRRCFAAPACASPVKRVHARVGKARRAEPIAAFFETGEAKLAGRFPDLEDQLAGLVVGGDYQGPARSPDRADAMVWAMTELLLETPRAEPRIRRL